MELGYLCDLFLVSWGKLALLLTFPLALLLLSPIGFGLLCFNFHFFLCRFWFVFLMSSVIFWLFRSMLFSLHMSVFLIFFSCSWHLILLHCDQKSCLEWFQFLNLARLELWPRIYSILENVPYALEEKRNVIVLGWNAVELLCLTGPLYHLKFVFPC